jgi:hypothetical protein
MKIRCQTIHKGTFGKYKKKGITYEPNWEKFENFLRDMGERPIGMELDRIDNNRGYSKENCRWISKSHNMSNIKKKRKIHLLPRGVNLDGVGYSINISINKQKIYLGYRKTIKEAKELYNKTYSNWYGELPPEYRLNL